MTNSLRVLAYHRVADPKKSTALDPRLISALPETFDMQMCHLSKHYHVVSMAQVMDTLSYRTHLPKRAVLITFDDAYRDLMDHALPTLQRWRLPATIFVPTAYPDHPERAFWWDRLYHAFAKTSQTKLHTQAIGSLPLASREERRHSLHRLREHIKTLTHATAMEVVNDVCRKLTSSQNIEPHVLSWDQLRQLTEQGITLGAHTRTHPILTRLRVDQVREEVAGSQEDLKREIGRVLPIFCYPNGGQEQRIVNVLREEGFQLAFTTCDGQSDLDKADLLRLCRTTITRRTSPWIFRLRLLRLVSDLDKLRHRKQRRRQRV